MRKLKHHEQKLLKKVDFLQWKNEHNTRELQVRPPSVRRYADSSFSRTPPP
jgi:U3 small nucleolar ribonucleoprotein protein IMP3